MENKQNNNLKEWGFIFILMILLTFGIILLIRGLAYIYWYFGKLRIDKNFRKSQREIWLFYLKYLTVAILWVIATMVVWLLIFFIKYLITGEFDLAH